MVESPSRETGHDASRPAWEALAPFGLWWKDRAWTMSWVQWFFFYAIFPFVLLHAQGSSAWLGLTALGLGGYFAVSWLLVLGSFLKPDPIGLRRMLTLAGFTATAGVAVVLLLTTLSPLGPFAMLVNTPFLVLRWLGFVVGVGVVEEAAKAGGLLVVMGPVRPVPRPITYMFAGAVCGLAFGVAEATGYSLQYRDALLASHGEGIGQYLNVQFLRLISLPLLHACWSGVMAYFLGIALIEQRRFLARLGMGLMLAALLHGTYDTFSEGWLGVGFAALSIFFFVGYARTCELMTCAANRGQGNWSLMPLPPVGRTGELTPGPPPARRMPPPLRIVVLAFLLPLGMSGCRGRPDEIITTRTTRAEAAAEAKHAVAQKLTDQAGEPAFAGGTLMLSEKPITK